MNSPGQKFVDDFDSEELSPLVPVFLRSAHIIYAHSVLQQQCGLGYTSEWARKNFRSVAEKNEFFAKLGGVLQPAQEDKLAGLDNETTAQEMLDQLRV